MLINFRKKGYNGIIRFVYEGKEKIHKYMQYKVSMTDCGGFLCICIPNMKFLCLTPWHGELCTDDADDANANIQSMTDKPNEPKILDA